MAEFKLGRLRFIWKGDWTPSNVYYNDDIVRKGGASYICVNGHTSTSNFVNDLEVNWEKISDGQQWQGTWSVNTNYSESDIVKYGGNVYIVNQPHLSAQTIEEGLEADIEKWDVFANGFDYTSDWQPSTKYRLNDLVKNGAVIYACIEPHVSSSSISEGLESDIEKWEVFSSGINYKNSWSSGTYYVINDLVKYGANIYVCVTGHLSTDFVSDQNHWEIFVDGIEYQNTWDSTKNYKPGDFVNYGGYSYISKSFNIGSKPDLNLNDWDLFTRGFRFAGEWGDDSTNQDYLPGDVVSLNGYTYLCTTGTHTDVYFDVVVQATDQGNKYYLNGNLHPDLLFTRGTTFTFNQTDETNVGHPLLFSETQHGIHNGGSEYTPGVKYFLDGTEVADSSTYIAGFDTASTRTIEITVDDTTVDTLYYYCYYHNLMAGDSVIDVNEFTSIKPPGPYWERLNSGFYWRNEYTDATFYELGDTIRFGDNSYVCIQEHIAEEGVNSPDADTTGQFWNLLSAGAEESVLAQQGDILYYGGAGPTRLPIGRDGQVLAVNATEDAPEWQYWGYVNNVYYVSDENGEDLPAPTYGINIDKPWKTLRYANKQVIDGPLNAVSKGLLYMNRSFIQQESVEWIDYQIANNNDPFVGFSYSKEEYAEAIGYVLDGLIHDIGHGGNEYSQKVAENFVNGKYASAVSGKQTETIAVLDFVVNTASQVVTNTSVDTNYQSENSVTDPIAQYMSYEYYEYQSEEQVPTIIGNLVELSQDAIQEGTVSILPNVRIPNNTIYVKTGLYKEVLPISVHKQTAIVGDELRSTRIEPAGSIIAENDVSYNLEVIEHLSAIVNDVVAGADNISPTTGNPIAYSDTYPLVGDSTSAAEASGLMQQIYDYIDYGINGATGDSTVPKKAGSNDTQDSKAYTYAVDALERNRQFIIQEALAYLDNKYPGYNYNELEYINTISRYIDAVQYDLRYTGNYASLTAAQVYLSSVTGSLEQDMFYLRNATGLRNCTVAGLTGTLSSENVYGTRRPSAGAYASLDPGWGPEHEEVWIKTRSPYVQGVTTFGTACVGMKVDGDLHAGGNDSIVANDFTQVLSDGIGAWVTNLGRAELVSVFGYYGHIGYLAENGGKVRATNGNSSYGTFGTVAEGVDETEVPVTGQVTNRAFDAIIENVFTDGDNILVFEYTNAGLQYTPENTDFVVTGEGFGAEIDTAQTVDGGVFDVRILNPDLDSDGEGDFGGADYVFSENVAQLGDTTSITLSNTEGATSAEYTGVAIFITSGLGAGQYGYIGSYNSGTKVASVFKYSDGSPGWDHLVPGSPIESTLDDTTNYSIEPRITFDTPASGLYSETTKARAVVSDGSIVRIKIWDPGQGYTSAPSLTVTDPNNTLDISTEVRIGDGVLTQPSWIDRGTAYATAEANVTGDGFADLYQPGEFLQVVGLSGRPLPGSTVTLGGLAGEYYKLVAVRDLSEEADGFAGQLQISPELLVDEAPEHEEAIELRIRYSQVRLTGHDFLDIGTGNFEDTNYPNDPLYDPVPEQETSEQGGGRVFYTSTDQDGNFRVGDLFSVEQSTGVATLNADAFNISGLNELSLGELALGGTGATITEFSADGTFTANSDNVVPTQKAIKTYITSQIGGGAGELNVNSLTAGQILITGQQISNVSGGAIDVISPMNFTAGVRGTPVALNYFLSGQTK
jgi:hypothetical protein